MRHDFTEKLFFEINNFLLWLKSNLYNYYILKMKSESYGQLYVWSHILTLT